MSDTLSKELESLRIERDRRPGPRRGLPGWAWKLLVAAVAVGAAGLLWRGAGPQAVDVARLTTIEVKEAATVLVAGGYVVAHHKIQLGSKVVGRVAWIGVEKGDRVKKDQVLVRLDNTEYRAQVEQARGALQAAAARLAQLQTGSRPEEIQQARARADETEANLRNAQTNYDRTRGLDRDGVVSKQELDRARDQLDMARAQAEQAHKNYELVHQGPRREEIDQGRALVEQARGALRYYETMLDATEIRSPIDGTVLERLVETGEMVTTMFVGETGAKSSVVSLADLNDLQVEVDISQTEFARVSLGQPCAVVPDAFPDRRYRAVVAEIAPQANRQKATVQVKVQVKNPDAYLRPEMNARVSFEDPRAGQASVRQLLAPRSALFQADGKSAVMAVENGRAVIKLVTAGEEMGGSVRIASGLNGDETLVVGSPAALKSGQRLRVK
ncbi:MAG: efflux RND transporter periplasmic adaptor subunit [Acidobacteria bacterium]|nr:efflux RND transporter periplasmic adaptor subunit [Acidobacteriota bacterium]